MWWSSLGRFWPYRTCNSDWSHKNLRGRLQNVGGGGSRISGGDVRCSFLLLLSLLELTVFDLLSTVLCKKVQRPACNCRFLLMLMFIFCFPQRRSLLAVYWGAETCQMTYFVFFHPCKKFFFISSSISSAPFVNNIFLQSVCVSDIFKISSLSAPSFVPLSLLFLRVSAQCPVEEESRLGPSSVSVRVAPQLAACPTRDLSLPGLATLSSAPLPPLSLHKAPARPQYWKVNTCQRNDLTCPLCLWQPHYIMTSSRTGMGNYLAWRATLGFRCWWAGQPGGAGN